MQNNCKKTKKKQKSSFMKLCYEKNENYWNLDRKFCYIPLYYLIITDWCLFLVQSKKSLKLSATPNTYHYNMIYDINMIYNMILIKNTYSL